MNKMIIRYVSCKNITLFFNLTLFTSILVLSGAPAPLKKFPATFTSELVKIKTLANQCN